MISNVCLPKTMDRVYSRQSPSPNIFLIFYGIYIFYGESLICQFNILKYSQREKANIQQTNELTPQYMF